MGFVSLDVQRCFNVQAHDGLTFNNCVVYPGAVSKLKILHFETGTVFDRVRIDMKDVRVVFLHIQQKMFVYIHDHMHTMGALRLSTLDLVTEVKNFILRGHSLKHADCQCTSHSDTQLSLQRQADYGLIFPNKCTQDHKRRRPGEQTCFLEQTAWPRNNEEICLEIGAKSMDTQINPVQTLQEMLGSSGIFKIHQDQHNNTVWSMAHSSDIASPEELLSFMQKHRFGVHRNHKQLQYPDAHLHLHALQRTNDVISIASANMYYVNEMKCQSQCDQDIRVLWKTAK